MRNRFQQPAMSSLVAFEAAARNGSFTRAADELAISQPAVSHAMRALETEVGVALFERRHKGVQTTAAGQYLLEQVSLALTLIEQALRDVRSLGSGRQVTLAVSTATATWWLMPRIARFKKLYPDIELRCITTDTDLDLGRERIDLAITLGTGEFSQHQRWLFVNEEVFPVCSPAFRDSHATAKDVQSLAGLPLLHLEERYKPRLDWAGWFARLGVTPARSAKQLSFNDYSIVVQAALEGQGVALGWRHIVEPLLAQGLLVRPIAHSVTTEQPIYIVASRRGKLRAEAVHLRDWLIAEAGATRGAGSAVERTIGQ
jgi:LysR family glycine cleavage system transcriptional activator